MERIKPDESYGEQWSWRETSGDSARHIRRISGVEDGDVTASGRMASTSIGAMKPPTPFSRNYAWYTPLASRRYWFE